MSKAAKQPDLTKDWTKPTLKINLGITKKILGAKGACDADKVWLCSYMQNKVAGECLPPSLYSNECYNVMSRLYGLNLENELERIRADWKSQNGL
jgi:hypothetical protein